MLMGEGAFNARLQSIKAAIDARNMTIDRLNGLLALADEMEDEDDAIAERKAAKRGMEEATEAKEALEKLLADVIRDWKEEKNRVIGHVVLSPPISFNYGDDGFTDDWAVVQVYPTKIARLNFIGNVIDLGSVNDYELTTWMYPHPANPKSFRYPGDRLLKCHGTVSDKEMYRPDPRNQDHNEEPVVMVLKNGNTTGLTVGRLNTIRAFVRHYFDGAPGEMSKEVSVLPRILKRHAYLFSECGDSGSVVIDGTGRIYGIITGGEGATDATDCTYVTSINFLLKRLAAFGIKANIFPLPADL